MAGQTDKKERFSWGIRAMRQIADYLWPKFRGQTSLFMREEFKGERAITWIRLIFITAIMARAYAMYFLAIPFYGQPIPEKVLWGISALFLFYVVLFVDLRILYFKRPDWYKPYYRYVVAVLDFAMITYMANEILLLMRKSYDDPVFTVAFSFFVIILYLFLIFSSALRFDPINSLFAMGLALVGTTYLFTQYMDRFTTSVAVGQLIVGGLISAFVARSFRSKIIKIHETALLERYLPQELVHAVNRNRRVLDMGGQLTKVAVLFSDIRGFTRISESKTPKEVIDFLNQYFSEMIEVIFAERGTLDKFIGDAIMAVYGAPMEVGDEPRRAVKTAIKMMQRLEGFNQIIQKNGYEPVRIGIGIAYGEVIAGNIGSQKRMDYTVIGDTVNIASRLEALNKEFHSSILVSEEIYHSVNGDYAFSDPRRVRLRGKSQEVAVYELEFQDYQQQDGGPNEPQN